MHTLRVINNTSLVLRMSNQLMGERWSSNASACTRAGHHARCVLAGQPTNAAARRWVHSAHDENTLYDGGDPTMYNTSSCWCCRWRFARCDRPCTLPLAASGGRYDDTGRVCAAARAATLGTMACGAATRSDAGATSLKPRVRSTCHHQCVALISANIR